MLDLFDLYSFNKFVLSVHKSTEMPMDSNNDLLNFHKKSV